MNNTITELFLSTYFSFEAFIGSLVRDSKILFDKLYSAFLLPEESKADLYKATQADTVREIKTYADYAQVCRIQKFSALSEITGISDKLYELIAIKGEALKKLKQVGIDELMGGTDIAACKLLGDTANMGLVSSLCMLGFLQCEGIYVSGNKKLGIKNLNKAAQWNSVEAILLSLHYDTTNRQKNLDRLLTATIETPYEGICETAQTVYGLSVAKEIPENTMLKKAFGAGTLKPNLYAPQYARFVFSDVLSFKDKERTLFSSHQEAISETADLPLKLTCGSLAFDSTSLQEMPLKRDKEQKRIIGIANNMDMRREATYRPLCITSDSDYMRSLYITAIEKAFSSAHIEKIDIADLNEYDFEPSKNNIFVRSCDEDKQNVYILKFKGEIRDSVFNFVKNFLQSVKRKEFRLLHPSATIDLSAILPICFCDRQNARLIKPFCDIVTLSPANEDEKVGILAHITAEKIRKYKITNLHTSQSAQDMLLSFSVDSIESLLDKVVRYTRKGQDVTVTVEMLQEISSSEFAVKNGYGFGGAGNGNK